MIRIEEKKTVVAQAVAGQNRRSCSVRSPSSSLSSLFVFAVVVFCFCVSNCSSSSSWNKNWAEIIIQQQQQQQHHHQRSEDNNNNNNNNVKIKKNKGKNKESDSNIGRKKENNNLNNEKEAKTPAATTTTNTVRELQNDPCSANLLDAILPVGAGNSASAIASGQNISIFLRTSFVEQCIESIQIDKENMLSHIRGLYGVFKQYYAFYDVCRNPSLSDPDSHQPELGYTLFGKGEGQVDLDVDLVDIFLRVNGTSGSTVSADTFWQIASIFNQLRDAHVSLPAFTIDLISSLLSVVPERCVNDSNTLARPKFYSSNSNSSDSGDLKMEIEWLNQATGEVTSNKVESINGKSIQDFVVQDLANSSALNVPYQSMGARVNSLLTVGTGAGSSLFGYTAQEKYTFYPILFSLVASGRPSDVLPDTFQVTYVDDDTPELFYTVVSNPNVANLLALDSTNPSNVAIDRNSATITLNEPGDSFLNFQEMVGRIVNENGSGFGRSRRSRRRLGNLPAQYDLRESLLSSRNHDGGGGAAAATGSGGATDEDTEEIQGETITRRAQQQFQQPEPFQFDHVFNVSNPVTGVLEPMAAYKIMQEEGYCVLKLQSFLIFPDEILNIWQEVALASKAAGVTKLVIDISSNGGGFLQTSYTLLAVLFPNMELKWFENQTDLTYNEPMDVFLNSVLDVVATMYNETSSILTDSDLQTFISGYTSAQFASLQATSEAMLRFCLSNCQDFQEQGQTCSGCSFLSTVYQDTVLFLTLQTPDSLRLLVQSTAFASIFIQPWTVTLSGAQALFSDKFGMRELIRGGVVSNLTEQTTSILESNFTAAVDASLATGHTFDDYILVSNGAAGSATCIFESFATQLWKNRDRSLVKSSLTTVSFGGGTAKRSDITMAGFPATVEDVNIQYPLVTSALIYMLETMVPSDSFFAGDVQNARRTFESTLYVPPYFADSLPRLPVTNYYDKFMDPGAMPLQYVKMPPDHHIPHLFTAVVFEDSSELGDLYSIASKFLPDYNSVSSASSPPLGSGTGTNTGTDTGTATDSGTDTGAATGTDTGGIDSGSTGSGQPGPSGSSQSSSSCTIKQAYSAMSLGFLIFVHATKFAF